MERIAAYHGVTITLFFKQLAIYSPAFPICNSNRHVKPALERRPAGVKLAPVNGVTRG